MNVFLLAAFIALGSFPGALGFRMETCAQYNLKNSVAIPVSKLTDKTFLLMCTNTYNYVLDNYWGATNDGNTVGMYQEHGGLNQRWQFVNVQNNCAMIRNVQAGKYLNCDVNGCTISSNGMLFGMTLDGKVSRCDDSGALLPLYLTDGPKLLSTTTSDDSQRWQLDFMFPPQYFMLHNNGYCVHPNNDQDQPDENSNVFFRSDCSSNVDRLQFYYSQQYQAIIHKTSGKCLFQDTGDYYILFRTCDLSYPDTFRWSWSSPGVLKSPSISDHCVHPDGGNVGDNVKLIASQPCDPQNLQRIQLNQFLLY